MTLTIHKLRTRCRAPENAQRARSVLDEVTDGPLARELGARLGPSLDHMSAVTRIRELRVKVRIPARQLTATKLAAVWAREFSVALHKSLARPDGGVPEVRRYASEAQYHASLIQHLLVEGSSPDWQFPELEKCRGHGTAQSSYEFLLQYPELIAETFAELSRRGWLEPLLGLWGEFELEQMMQVIAVTSGRAHGLSLSSLIELGRLAAASGGLHAPWPASSRRQALRLWSRLAGNVPVRDVWHGLRLLVRWLEQPDALAAGNASLLSDPIPFPEWCELVVREAAGLPLSVPFDARHSNGFSLDSVLQNLRPLVPSAAIPGKRANWVRSDCCGLMLLLSIVRRMDLWRLTGEPEFVRFGGPRAFSFLLAATGMTILGKLEMERPMDPAIELFAGIQAPIDRAGLKQFFAEANPAACSGFVPGETWAEILQNLAAEITHGLARRVRGFRQASREALVSQFVRKPGRVLVEEERLLVILEPNPWWVALHISGVDESLPSIEWMGGIRVDFVLEGL